jgi:hypothetical protein
MRGCSSFLRHERSMANRDVGRHLYGPVSMSHSPPHGECIGIACFRNHHAKTLRRQRGQKNVTSNTQVQTLRRRYPQ